MHKYKEVPNYNGKYLLSRDGVMLNSITGKVIKPKVRGKESKCLSFRLYGENKATEVKSVISWLMITYPDWRKTGFKDIKGFEGEYGISRDGKVYSYKLGRVLKANPSTTSPYLYVRLTHNNISRHYSVHRLVANTYIPNPKQLPEVDHIDRNIHNNNVDNLRWVNRTGNLKNSKCGFVRNHRECLLMYKGKQVKICKSIAEAARLGAEMFGASRSGLDKYLKSKDCEIKSVTTSPLGRRVEN